MKMDIDIQRDVLEELKWEPSVNAAHIGVSVKEGIVTLSGHVSSFAEKYEAERNQGEGEASVGPVSVEAPPVDEERRSAVDAATSPGPEIIPYLRPVGTVLDVGHETVDIEPEVLGIGDEIVIFERLLILQDRT